MPNQIDYTDSAELVSLSMVLRQTADSLKETLCDTARLQAELDRELSKQIDVLIARKKNIGIDMAMILLMSKDTQTADKYSRLLLLKAECKGIQAVKEAVETQIILIQSLLKHTLKETGNG